MKCFHQIPVFQRDIYLFNLTTVNSVCKIIGYCLKLMVTVTSNPYSKTLCKGVWFITARIVHKEARKTKKINNTLDKTWNKYWMLPWHDGSYMQTKVTSQIHLELKPLYRSLVITLSSDKESLYKPQHVQKPYKSTWTNQIHPQKPQNAGSVRSAISHDSCACTQASSDVGGHGWLLQGRVCVLLMLLMVNNQCGHTIQWLNTYKVMQLMLTRNVKLLMQNDQKSWPRVGGSTLHSDLCPHT